jgi:hypothetical protein
MKRTTSCITATTSDMLTIFGNTGGKASQRHAGVRERPLAHHFLQGRQRLFAYRVQRQGGANRGGGDGRARRGGAVATTASTSASERLHFVANGSWPQRSRRKLPVTGRPPLRGSGWPVSGSSRMVTNRAVRREGMRCGVCAGHKRPAEADPRFEQLRYFLRAHF